MFSKLPPEIIVAGIIIFGAIVHATAQFKVARENDVKHSLLDYIINLVIAAFSGMMFGLLGSLHFDNLVVLLLASGAGAFLGIRGLNIMSGVMVTSLKGALKNWIK